MAELQFSSRLPDRFDASPLAEQLAAYQDVAIDLSVSNPTLPELNFAYPNDAIAASFVAGAAGPYGAEPLGMVSARVAVRDYLWRAGMRDDIDVDQIMLTASTSEAYSMIVKLLCNPGDAIAVGAPGYPLVQHLAELECVRCIYFDWHYIDRCWQIDRESVSRVIKEGAKAIVLVTPNNPTGACVDADMWAWLRATCADAGVALISDEVFAPYGWHGKFASGALRHAMRDSEDVATWPLTFVLDGLSKAAGLPQMKIAWTVVAGPDDAVARAMDRLAWIGDTYLSVASPVQRALPMLFNVADTMQQQIRARVVHNQHVLREALQHNELNAVEMLHGDAGWYAVLRVPCVMDEDAWVLHLAQDAGVIVQPGYYFDFAKSGFLVVGLLQPEEKFMVCTRRFVDGLRCALG